MAVEKRKPIFEEGGRYSGDDDDDYQPYDPLKLRRQEQLARLGIKRNRTAVNEERDGEEETVSIDLRQQFGFMHVSRAVIRWCCCLNARSPHSTVG